MPTSCHSPSPLLYHTRPMGHIDLRGVVGGGGRGGGSKGRYTYTHTKGKFGI